jgi:NhaP-type Na+/H+ and K+/H+ antiporter
VEYGTALHVIKMLVLALLIFAGIIAAATADAYRAVKNTCSLSTLSVIATSSIISVIKAPYNTTL